MGKYKARIHYQDPRIVEGYEEKRFSGLSGWLRVHLERRAVAKALRRLGKGSTILDLPCGTGRFASLLWERADRLVEADISLEMIQFARKRTNLERGILGFVRCDAEALPFRDGAFDCVLCFRFLPHLPLATRERVLRELARVSRGGLILDYRYRYAFRSLSRWIRHRLGLAKPLRPRYSLSQICEEVERAGLSLRKWISVVWLFSEKLILLCERPKGAGGTGRSASPPPPG
ncbi:MAG: class I SAM-dependent methyltransferase [candidate division NC10 bacterium]|nr:class I SAM-dependent methyltransferase [candidate division NC10 bacterium]